MKSIGEMSDHEMLVELMKDKKRRDSWRTIKIGAYVVVIAAVVAATVMYAPKIVGAVKEVQTLMGKINELADKTSGVMSNFGNDTITQLKSAIEKLNNLLSALGL